jgi:hypothetical protein
VSGCAAIVSSAATRAIADDEEEQQPLVIRVYRVIDLVAPVPNYPYEGTFLPGMSRTTPGTAGSTGLYTNAANGPGIGMGGMGGGMGGGMIGGMGGGMGGGMFRVNDVYLAQQAGAGQSPAAGGGGGIGGGVVVGGGVVAGGGGMGGGMARNMMQVAPAKSSIRITMGSLMNAITSLIEPDTWDDNGGPASIHPVGGALGISQTVATHAKIEEFLTALRQESGTLRTLSVNAHWLKLDDAQLAKLQGAGEKKRATATGDITRERLAALPAETHAATGRIACFSGQTVHVISGLMETKLQGAVPVVGGPNGAAYQPTITAPHLGTLLQISASLLPGDEAVLVDLHSSVTNWEDGGDPVKLIGADDEGDAVVQIDRLKLGAQQLATSLRVALGKPTLVGGMSDPTAEAGDAQNLYLVVEVTASEVKSADK